MTDTAPKCTLVIEREMLHPSEKVWRALTESSLIDEWLMKNDFKLIVGHRFQFAPPRPQIGAGSSTVKSSPSNRIRGSPIGGALWVWKPL